MDPLALKALLNGTQTVSGVISEWNVSMYPYAPNAAKSPVGAVVLPVDSFIEPYSLFDRAGLILANLDAIWHYTGCLRAHVVPRDIVPFQYRLINATEGSIRYMQYRSYSSVGEAVLAHVGKTITVDDRVILRGTTDTLTCAELVICLLDGNLSMSDVETAVDVTADGGICILQLPLDHRAHYARLAELATNFRYASVVRPISLADDSIFLMYHTRYTDPDDYGIIEHAQYPELLEAAASVWQPIDLTTFIEWLDSTIAYVVQSLNSLPSVPLWTQSLCCAYWNIPSRELLTR
jgi:hypothetical protein